MCFSSPKIPAPPPPPPLPPPPPEPPKLVDEAVRRSREDERRRRLAAGGTQGTIVTGGQGLLGSVTLGTSELKPAKKTLLGA